MSQSGPNSAIASSGIVDTLTGNSGGAVGPDVSNNIDIVGTNTVTVTGNNGTATLTISPTTSGYPITPYVVGPSGQAGYQTIQSAINAAHAAGGAQIIYLQPGTYTENLTFYDGIQIQGTQAYENSFSTVIVGVHTPPLAGEIALGNIEVQSATDIFFSNGSGACAISFLNSTFNLTNGYIFNLPNWSGIGFNINNCGELSTNNGVINNSGGAAIFTNNCQIGAGSAKTFTTNGDVRLDLTFLNCPANISGGAIFVNFALFAYTVTCSGTASGTFLLINSFPTAIPAFTISTSQPITIENSIITTTNNPAISGAGAGVLTLGNVTFVSNSSISNSLTLASSGATVLGEVRANADSGGLPGANSLSSANSTSISSGTGTVKMSSTNNANNAAWIKIYIGTTAYWIPAWTTNSP